MINPPAEATEVPDCSSFPATAAAAAAATAASFFSLGMLNVTPFLTSTPSATQIWKGRILQTYQQTWKVCLYVFVCLSTSPVEEEEEEEEEEEDDDDDDDYDDDDDDSVFGKYIIVILKWNKICTPSDTTIFYIIISNVG